MVLTLQRQLLIKAADNVADAERDRLKLSGYAHTVPSIEALRGGSAEFDFVATTQGIAQLFNGAGARGRAEQRLNAAVEAEFATLTARYLDENPRVRPRARPSVGLDSDRGSDHADTETFDSERLLA